MPRKRLFAIFLSSITLFTLLGGFQLFEDRDPQYTDQFDPYFMASMGLKPLVAPDPLYQTVLQQLGVDKNIPCDVAALIVAQAAPELGCTTTCTNNKLKPCSGYSSCYNKNISCSSAGKDQDGRNCNGCCFSCVVKCDPPPNQPPTVNGSFNCSALGNNDWCIGANTLSMTANDPQNYPVTIAGEIGGAPFTCAVGTSCQKNLPQGSGAIRFWATSSAGTSGTANRSWKRDISPPTLTYNFSGTAGNAGWYLSPVTVTLSGADAYSGVASEEIGSSGANSVTLTEGIHNLGFSVTDVAGHSTTSTATLKIDTTDPALSISVDQSPNAASWYTVAPQLSVSGTDALSGVASETIRVDGAAAQSSPVTLADGTHTVVYTVADVAGNQVSQTRTYQVDTTAPILNPQISLASPDGKNGWYTQNISVDLLASDATSGLAAKTLDVNGSSTSLPASFSDGVYTLVFSGTDQAGNTSSVTRNAKVDTIRPSMSISVDQSPNAGGWYNQLATLSVSGADALSGVTSETISVDGGSTQSSPVTLTEGIHSVEYSIEDAAGNLNSATRQYKIDITPPDATFVEPGQDGNNGWHRSSPTVRVLNADSLSGIKTVRYRLNGGAWQNGDRVTLPEGVYVVAFSVLDAADNEIIVQKTIRVDLTEPASAFTSHADGDVVAGIVYLTGKTDDATSGPAANGEISFDNGASWQPITLDVAGNWSASWNAYALPNGDYTLLMRGEDIAGNPEHTAALTLTVRNAPPAVDLKPGNWAISDSGTLIISETGIEIAKISLVFRDPEGRYPRQKVELRPNPMTGTVTWDRRFGDGTIAPWGTYEVMVVACDIFDNCARDISTITIPFYTLTVPTVMPTETPLPTPTPTEEMQEEPTQPTRTAANPQIKPQPLPTLPPAPPEPAADYSEAVQAGLMISATLGYLLLLLMLLLAVDPRPKALNQLSKTGRVWLDLQTNQEKK